LAIIGALPLAAFLDKALKAQVTKTVPFSKSPYIIGDNLFRIALADFGDRS